MLNDIQIKKIDSSDMYSLLKNTHLQLEKSLNTYDRLNFNTDIDFQNIIVNGMGGSAIGGDFVSTLLIDELKIPLIINRSYNIPNWVNKKTLVVLCSYSGNTEETISCYNECIKRKIKPLIISSGGYLSEQAQRFSYNYVKLESGIQPRAAFGFSSSILLLSLVKFNLISTKFISMLEDSVISLKLMSENLSLLENSNEAINLAEIIHGKRPIIYGSTLTEVVANRFKCQLAENAKVLSQNATIPEQNHNEIEGYVNQNNKNSIILWIYDQSDHLQTKKRIKVTGDLLKPIFQTSLTQKGAHLTERLYKSIYFCDWVSYYTSILYNTDPTPVTVIEALKEKMSK